MDRQLGEPGYQKRVFYIIKCNLSCLSKDDIIQEFSELDLSPNDWVGIDETFLNDILKIMLVSVVSVIAVKCSTAVIPTLWQGSNFFRLCKCELKIMCMNYENKNYPHLKTLETSKYQLNSPTNNKGENSTNATERFPKCISKVEVILVTWTNICTC